MRNQGKLGYIVDGRVIDSAAAGGPERLANALELSAQDLKTALDGIKGADGVPLESVELLAPIDWQEIWAAGVTYLRSRDARMEESQEKSVYDRVYDADRPELFLKANIFRTSGPGQPVGIRGDSTWDVPEPECVLVINSAAEIVGYTVGNDVSSRSIEGENPLYLPQAKMFDKGAGLGPVIALAWEIDDPANLPITLVISRGGKVAFEGKTSTSQMHRTFDDLVGYLFRYQDFFHGVFLMTGTGIVPPNEFTLEDGDHVAITIDGIGTLENPVVRLA
ncbi:MAG: fumarylacetoacetate hydrolase family protein [Thermomicrobiales bacterium]|nr:fumarylacetoacetate hydrolase family protein [Thermomicrobiales bacterium]